MDDPKPLKSIPRTFDEFQEKLNLQEIFESFDFNCFSSYNRGVIWLHVLVAKFKTYQFSRYLDKHTLAYFGS